MLFRPASACADEKRFAPRRCRCSPLCGNRCPVFFRAEVLPPPARFFRVPPGPRESLSPAKRSVSSGRSRYASALVDLCPRMQTLLRRREPALPESALPRFCRTGNRLSLVASSGHIIQTNDHGVKTFLRAQIFGKFLRGLLS